MRAEATEPASRKTVRAGSVALPSGNRLKDVTLGGLHRRPRRTLQVRGCSCCLPLPLGLSLGGKVGERYHRKVDRAGG
jgi:hypothetical protein